MASAAAAGTAGGREIDGAGRKEEARMRFFRIEVCLLQTSRAQFSALFGLPPSRCFLIAQGVRTTVGGEERAVDAPKTPGAKREKRIEVCWLPVNCENDDEGSGDGGKVGWQNKRS